ncbi:MAG: 5-(carboxyamino)imidazole ribonucleotide synthase [Burkholderiaceae bacterium]|nr:5-(carboxyamino)imidazole ribonucleotide synthase [Burkholderiaceae bacterium]
MSVKTAFPILPGATLGVLGGGQLGRMFVHAAQSMGYDTAVLEPDTASPAGLVSHHHIQTAYLDEAGLAKLAKRCAAITTEFENVPASALQSLALQRPVSPSAESVAIAQDRVREKAHFVACAQKAGQDAISVAPYAVIETPAQLAAVSDNLLPGILKTARMGYDGKGQIRVSTRAELAVAWASLKKVSCVLEKMLPLKAEYSVILARGADGSIVHFPPQLNMHVDGILATTSVYDGNMPLAGVKRAVDAAKSIANELQYVGVLCVELFLLHDDSLVVNEIAPRPHNSGHYTLDACDVTQFELQVRTLCGLPLTQPRQHSPAIMLNLLGDLWFAHGAAQPETPPWAQILALPGAHLHLYGKKDAKKGRKMGHLTLTGATVEAVQATTAKAAQILGIAKY